MSKDRHAQELVGPEASGESTGPKRGGAVARVADTALVPARSLVRAVPRAVEYAARELVALPARGWLLAERCAAISARSSDAGEAVSALIEELWQLAQDAEARVLHVENSPLGPERTTWVLSPRVEALIAAGMPPEEAAEMRPQEPVVVVHTGGLVSSHEAVALELEVPESRLRAVIARLEALGEAGAALGEQLRALPAHALPLRSRGAR